MASTTAIVTGSANAGAAASTSQGSKTLPTNQSYVNTRGYATNSTTPASSNSVNVEVAPVEGNPATTPLKNTYSSTLGSDSYRNGKSSNGIEDNLLVPRTLGESEDTIATISITSDKGGDLRQALEDSGDTYSGDIITTYSRFFLQSVNESQVEKYQVVETFTAFYTFFYGKRPSVYSFRGVLINDQNHKWTNDLTFYYENYFRGTRTAELEAQAVIAYDGRLVSGFIIGLNVQQTTDLEKGALFSMDVLVTEHVPVYFSQDIISLINSASEDLARRSQQIANQIKIVNKSVPGLEKNIAANATTDNIAASKNYGGVDTIPKKAVKQAKSG